MRTLFAASAICLLTLAGCTSITYVSWFQRKSFTVEVGRDGVRRIDYNTTSEDAVDAIDSVAPAIMRGVAGR